MIAPQGLESGPFGEKYVIERRIGAGATATVHRARDTATNTVVAIKILRQELAGSAAAAKFLKEIHRTSALEHPYILPVLDSGEWEGRPFFVLPFMEGGTLRGRLERERQLQIADVIAIARVVAEALDYANERGLVHRDVKPENILFTKGEARLADFGIARALQAVYGDATTSSATIRGTPAYMSPEQAAGSDDLDGRSDQYALACVVYEMISGMQAFMGPTPEAVMAMRFKHTPRDIRVFRPTVPAGIDPVMTKAFALAPADRYACCVDFVNALETAPGAIVVPPPPTWPRRAVLAGATVLLSAIAIGSVAKVKYGWGERSITLDSTRVALLPLVVEGSRTPPWRDDDLLRQGLARWRGVSVVDQYLVADVVRRRGAIETADDATGVATALGAGRYVRGRLSPVGDGWRASLSLYDAASSQPLYERSEPIPNDIAAATAAYARLADSLLLRGVHADSVPVAASGSRSLPAVQAFARAQAALDDWDLSRADSAFEVAVGLDPEYGRASLWLAQVRVWRDMPRREWTTVAERSLALTQQLSERERRLAAALVALAHESYESACSMYDSLRLRNDRDFAAWFGMGKCRMMDRAVVPDRISPSGWRFRMSAHQAMSAYTRAFEILPSVHRGYERGAFEQLRVLLMVSTDLVRGRGLADSALFLARPGWMGDTLALIPYPWNVVAAGDSASVPPGMARALAERRAAFRRIAAGWSAAFPQSAGAKYAVAISLELLAQSNAVDTLRLARSLSSDVAFQRRLAMSEVMWLVKFGAPDDRGALARASALADTLLRADAALHGEDAGMLAAVAALTGRCRQSDRLLRASAQTDYGISAQLFADAKTLLLRSILDCFGFVEGATLMGVVDRIEREFPVAGGPERATADGILLFRPLLFARDARPELIERVAKVASNDFLAAALAVARGDSTAARVALSRADRVVSMVVPTPDMSLASALLRAQLRDSAHAARALDASLTNARNYDLDALEEPAKAAAFAAGILMRTRLARAAGDAQGAQRWGAALRILWSGADAPLRAVLEQSLATTR